MLTSPIRISLRNSSLYSWFVSLVSSLHFCSQSCATCKEKRPAHSLCTSCNKWLCSSCTEEHEHGKETGDRFLSVSLKGCTGTEDTFWKLVSSHISCLSEKEAVAGSVSQALCCMTQCVCQWEADFPVTSEPLAQAALHIIGKMLDICFTETVFSTCLFSLWSDGLGSDP